MPRSRRPDPGDRALLDALLRTDLTAFIQRAFQTVDQGGIYQHNWHIDAIAYHLEQCRLGRIKRLVITLPPRNLKSICASIAFPAWLLGHDPTLRIITVSYASDLAYRFARGSRTIMESAWYRRVFPRTRVNRRKATEQELETTQGGSRFATSVGGTLTGRGGTVIIIDDPLKAQDATSETVRSSLHEWYETALLSRLDSKANGVIIIIQQRLHPEDLVGHVLAKGGGWVHLDLPAIAEEPQTIAIGPGEVHRRTVGEALHPAREPREVLDEIKAAIGSRAFAASYQQQPIPLEGNLVRWSWVRTYDQAPELTDGDVVTQSWDTATKGAEVNDYSVCITVLRRGDLHYILDVYRERLDYPTLKRRVIELHARFKPDNVLIEDAGSGASLIQDLRHEGSVHPIAIKPEGDKVTRLAAQSAKIEAGKVLIPTSASWLEAFKAELLLFPNARHDDQVDALAQYLGWRGSEGGWEGEVVVCYPPFAAMVARGIDPFAGGYFDRRPWTFSSKDGWRPVDD